MGLFDRLRKSVTTLVTDASIAPTPTPATPITKQAPAPAAGRTGALTEEMGTAGVKRVGGVLVEEWLPHLQGERGRRVLREMSENDPTVGAVLFAIEMLVRQVEWSVEPAVENDEQEQEKADFLWDCLNDLDRPWTNVVSEILTVLPHGWSIHELVYKLRRGGGGNPASKHDDGRIGWKRLPIRGQETLLEWAFSEDGEDVEAFVQVHPVNFQRIEIPSWKFLHFKTRERRGPEGISILRNAYRPWFFKKRLEEIEAIGIERDMAGLPVASVPPELLSPNASAEQVTLLNEIKKLVRGVKINEQMGVVFPLEYDQNGKERYKFELLSAFGSKSRSPEKAIQRYKQDIAMTALADFILLGHEKVGSFALSSSKTEIFAAAMGAWLDMITNTINEQAVPRLFALNGMDGPYPHLVHGDIETPDLDALSNFILRCANAGALTLPDEKLERHIRRAASLPEQDEGEGETPQPPQGEE